MLRAAEGRPERRARGGDEPPQRGHRLRAHRPGHHGQDPAHHHQPRPHRLHRRPGVSLRVPAVAQSVQRDLRHRELPRTARGRPRPPQGQEDRGALPRLALRKGDPAHRGAPGEEVRILVDAHRSPAPGHRAGVAVAPDQEARPRLHHPPRLGHHEPGRAQDRGQDRLSRRPHHRQHLEQLGRRRHPRGRRRHRVHRDHHAPLGQGLSRAAGRRQVRRLAGQREHGGPEAGGHRVLQPGNQQRYLERRGGARRPGQVRREAADGRAGALGLRAHSHRRRAAQGAGCRRPPAAHLALVRRPRGRRRGALRAVGRQEVQRDQRLDQGRPRPAPPDHRRVVDEVRRREGHHHPRLRRRGEALRS